MLSRVVVAIAVVALAVGCGYSVDAEDLAADVAATLSVRQVKCEPYVNDSSDDFASNWVCTAYVPGDPPDDVHVLYLDAHGDEWCIAFPPTYRTCDP